jgi:hypothetical protein
MKGKITIQKEDEYDYNVCRSFKNKLLIEGRKQDPPEHGKAHHPEH